MITNALVATPNYKLPDPAYSFDFPDYLRISAAELGKGQSVKVRVLADAPTLAKNLAEAILTEIRAGEHSDRGATLIIPVGPVDRSEERRVGKECRSRWS